MSSTRDNSPEDPASTGAPAAVRAEEKRQGRRRRPDLDTIYTINTDGSRNFLHPADVKGRWTTRLDVFWTLLIVVYAGLPWITLGGHPAVYFDLPGRSAYLFGQSFTNQDFYLSFFLFTAFGFALFVATALFGRVWCGFACPQTVFLEGVVRRIERWVEGPRNARIRRNLGPATFDKVWRKLVKHVLFLGVSYAIAHVFLSYFIPVRDLLEVMRSDPRDHLVAFGWTMFFTGLMYFDYSWFREQTCLIICPYGRLQSALLDQDTIVIGYDEARGEPRARGVDEGGDCIDCYRCVEVCPTGIDIRNGLQMECLGCTKCIDACDDIMRRIDKPEGLVRYDSRRAFAGEPRRGLWRPRVLLYFALGLVGMIVAGFSFLGRETFQANVLRARGIPYVIEGDHIRNLYSLHLQNKGQGTRTLLIEPRPSEGVEFLVSQPRVYLDAMEDVEVPVFAVLPRDAYLGQFDLSLTVADSATGETHSVDVKFRGP